MNKKNIIEKHKNLKLPPFPLNANFSEWVEELIELDAYYFGLATSLLNGERNVGMNMNKFIDLKKRLNNFKALEDDQIVYQHCKDYINSLENVMNLVIEYSKK